MKNQTYIKPNFLTVVQLYLHRFKVSSSLVKGFTEKAGEQVYKLKLTGQFFPSTLCLNHTRNTFTAYFEEYKVSGSFSYDSREIYFLCNRNGVSECFSLSFDYIRTL